MQLKLAKKKEINEDVLRMIIQYGLGFASRVKNLEDKCIEKWEADKLYTKEDSFVIYDNYLWQAKVTNQSSTWNENYWDKIGDNLELIDLDTIKTMLGLTTDELQTLSSIILDSEVRLDKTYSSSKIYTDLQQCLSDSKAFTLQEFAKASKASYHVVSATSEMTDKSVIYLMPNSTNYDMYIVESDGTPVKIGDTTIDLSQFYTKTEIDNDFVKKTDADGKYALITTVDKKAEKTDLNNHINDTVAHMTQSEKDSYALKSSITDTIDSTSTSTDIASAKGVYDFKNYTIINYPDLRANNTITVFSDILKLMPINKTWYIVNFKEESLTTADEIEKFGFPTNMNAWGNIQITCKQRFDTMQSYYIELQTDGNSQFTYRWLGECTSVKSGDVEAYAIQWKMLCSTSVADIPLKKLVNSTDIKSDAVINYMVKNGMCTVSINTLSSSKMSTGNITLTTGLPIPFNTSCWYSICTNSNATTAPLQNLLLRIDSTGNLIAYKGTDNVNYFGTFTYPVRK